MRILTLLITLLPLQAAAFTARNGMEAEQVSPSEIAVHFRQGRADTDYWCAAGDFAQSALGLPVQTRLWRASPKPRRSGQGILFTLDPARQAPDAGLSQFGAGPRDGAMSLGAAVAGHCRIIPPFPGPGF